jgi:hypothetical protein
MNNRRDFLKTVAILGAVGTSVGAPEQSSAQPPPSTGDGSDDRTYWVAVLEKLANPILVNLSHRVLKKTMPVESNGDATDRRNYTHLEAFGRLLAGMAPWLVATGLSDSEAKKREHLADLARTGLDAATNPQSPDYMNFSHGGQPLVDAAFLAQAILRAPDQLWSRLELRVRRQIVDALKSTRNFRPPANNWVMFAATIEAALLEMGEPTLVDRLENNVRQMLDWYLGDSIYGDGAGFDFDYYNSFVIHPMLVDVFAVLGRNDDRFNVAGQVVRHRATRYAEILERLIAPDGTFPSIGRSTTYRFGAFHLLAQMALLRELPDRVKPAQVRSALTAVMRRMIEMPGTFDADGWLRIGFCGAQPSLAESYISTGSLYLCSMALLPLGLPPTDAFWNSPPAAWTSKRLWSGEALPADHALARETKKIEIPNLAR